MVWCQFMSTDTGKYQGHLIRLGSRGDSYYEYLLKQYLQTNKQELVYWDMYRESVEGVKKHLVSDSYPSGLTFNWIIMVLVANCQPRWTI